MSNRYGDSLVHPQVVISGDYEAGLPQPPLPTLVLWRDSYRGRLLGNVLARFGWPEPVTAHGINMPLGPPGETGESDPFVRMWQLLADLGHAYGALPLRRPWEMQLVDRQNGAAMWRFCINGAAKTHVWEKHNEVPQYCIAVKWRGDLVGYCDPVAGGTFAVGSVVNLHRFVAAVGLRITWAAVDKDVRRRAADYIVAAAAFYDGGAVDPWKMAPIK